MAGGGRVKNEFILFCFKIGAITACLYVRKWIQEREDGCLKEDELTTGMKLLRRGGIWAKVDRFPSLLKGKMKNVGTGVERLVDRMVGICSYVCPNPSVLFEL